jgi:hypothetical protein
MILENTKTSEDGLCILEEVRRYVEDILWEGRATEALQDQKSRVVAAKVLN